MIATLVFLGIPVLFLVVLLVLLVVLLIAALT